MKLQKRFFQKLAFAVFLLVLSALVSTLIYNSMMLQQPLNALPNMRVFAHVELDGRFKEISSYDWSFFYTSKSDVVKEPDSWMLLPAAMVDPGAPLKVTFSPDCKDVKISFTEGENRNFIEVGGESQGELRTSTQPGIYTYRVEASWARRGSVQYYFKVKVVGPDDQSS